MGKTAENIAKIVGANDEKTGEMLSYVYGAITHKGCKFVGSIEVAEAAKMVENTQRDIDIAFVNELAKTLPGWAWMSLKYLMLHPQNGTSTATSQASG